MSNLSPSAFGDLLFFFCGWLICIESSSAAGFSDPYADHRMPTWQREIAAEVWLKLAEIKLKKMRYGVHFINVFRHSFYLSRSRKCKKLLDLTVFFVLLGSASIKAAHKIMVKLTPVVETDQFVPVMSEYN